MASGACGGATLYVLRAGVEDLYKVGRTTAPLERRVAQLNTGAARKLSPVASFAVPQALLCKCESWVHAALRELAAAEAGGKEFFRCACEAALRERVRLAWQEFLSLAGAVEGAGDDAAKLAELFGERRRVVGELKRLELRKALIEEHLLPRCEEGFSVEERPLLSWQKRSCDRFDLEAFRQDHPELAAVYMRPRVVRTPIFH